MTNMHYCRFQNTHNDLLDCLDVLNDEEELSEDEYRACRRMLTKMVDFLYIHGIIDGDYEELTENLDEYMATIPSEGM